MRRRDFVAAVILAITPTSTESEQANRTFRIGIVKWRRAPNVVPCDPPRLRLPQIQEEASLRLPFGDVVRCSLFRPMHSLLRAKEFPAQIYREFSRKRLNRHAKSSSKIASSLKAWRNSLPIPC